MKRLLSILLVSILLVSVLVFSVTATVYAAENSGGSSTINVAGEYSTASTGEVVSVDVGWEEMSFKYTEGEKQWDPGTHSYIGGENGGWSDNKPGITMTNHSNVDVVAELSFAPAASVTGTFYSKSGNTYTALSADEQGANLSAAAEGSEQSAADAKTFYFGISGGAIKKNTSLGTITVRISFKPAFNEADLAAFTYTTDSYGRVKITGVKDTSVTELVVPDFVYEIECGALKDCTSLVKLTVPFAGNRSNGEYYSIGYAFGAKETKQGGDVLPATLKDITVTGGYSHNETICSGAFYDCQNLTSIVIGDGVTYIGENALYDCVSLEKISLPFVGDKLRSMNEVPLGFDWIFDSSTEQSAKMSMTNCKSISILYSVWDSDVSSTNKYIPISLKEVTIRGGCIPNNAFLNFRNIEKIVIGDGVTHIGYCAFYDCAKLSEVTIPVSVLWIGASAFGETPFYDTLKANAENDYIYINKVLFEYVGTDSNIEIKEGTFSVSDAAFNWNSSIQSVKCPSSLRYLGCSNSSASTEGVFTNCTALTTIEINDGLEYIGCSAFVNCSNLKDINFPDSITFVGDFAFSNTGWVNELSNGEIYIGKVFYKYKGEMPEDTTITIKDGTVSIASYSLGNRTSLGECQGYSQLKKVIIPDTVTCIGNSAFIIVQTSRISFCRKISQ